MMMMIMLIQLLSVAAMDPSTVRWTKGYDFGEESHPHAGVETSDGGFLMVGTTKTTFHTRKQTFTHTHKQNKQTITHTYTHTR